MRFALPRLVLTLALLGFLLSACDGEISEGERPPTPLELAFTALALDMEWHEPCLRIHPEAVVRAPFNSSGTRIYHERARCFFLLAHSTLNPHFCRFVVEAKSFWLGGDYFSASNCEAVVGQGRSFKARLSLDHELLLKALGYTADDIGQQFPNELAELAWLKFYLGLFKSGDELRRRLHRLPRVSGG